MWFSFPHQGILLAEVSTYQYYSNRTTSTSEIPQNKQTLVQYETCSSSTSTSKFVYTHSIIILYTNMYVKLTRSSHKRKNTINMKSPPKANLAIQLLHAGVNTVFPGDRLDTGPPHTHCTHRYIRTILVHRLQFRAIHDSTCTRARASELLSLD